MSENEITKSTQEIDDYTTNYVGIDLYVDGIALKDIANDPGKFTTALKAIRSVSTKPIILVSDDPSVVEAGLAVLEGETPLVYAANAENWEGLAALAKGSKTSLAVTAENLDDLADLTQKIQGAGLEDMVLGPISDNLSDDLTTATTIRRLAIKKNFRALGYPVISFPTTLASAAQAITKYAGFIVLDHFSPEYVYPLLVLRQNIYTDPQKPIQVQPGLYEINDPKAKDPVLVTTNFSITYFSVANEVEGAGLPAWLLVTDAEGMSVLTAWAAGKFDAERIAKAVKSFDVADKIDQKRIVLPGHVAVLSGELEEELPNWEIRVGPREAVDLPAFMKQAL
jgi:acetyl-CoA decarbonylase/synthase complex subunit gamma